MTLINDITSRMEQHTSRLSERWRYSDQHKYFQRTDSRQTDLPDVREEHKFRWEIKPGELQLRFEHRGAYGASDYTGYYIDILAHLLRKHRREFSSP